MKLSEYIAKNGDKEVSQEELNKLLGIKESKAWKPKVGEVFWLVYADGDIDNFEWRYVKLHEKTYNLGNCYKTEEEAIFARDKKLFEAKMERYLRENEDEEVDWNNYKQAKYEVAFSYKYNSLYCPLAFFERYEGAIYTTSKGILEQFIQKNEQDIKKYLFGVK